MNIFDDGAALDRGRAAFKGQVFDQLYAVAFAEDFAVAIAGGAGVVVFIVVVRAHRILR